LYYARLIVRDGISLGEVLASFTHALRLDAVAASYMVIFPFLLLVIQSVYSPKWLNIVNKVYTIIILSAYSLITTAELGIYGEWKTKLPAKALNYLDHPDEIYNTAPTWTFILLITLFFIQVAGSFYLYNRYFYKNLIDVKRNWIFTLLFLILTPGFILIGLRGGVQEIVIVQSDAYFSNHNILNIAATNSGYNFMQSYFENRNNMDKNPFEYYPLEEAKQTVAKLYEVQKDTTVRFLKVKKPNIVFVILESWSADLLEELGGMKGVAPEMSELADEGVLFSNIYSSSERSEQGISCLFGGFPAHPISCVTIQPDKYKRTPNLNHILKKEGYFSSYYFGGQLIYGNMKGYVYYSGFERITEIYDFPSDIPQGKLGVHDADVFNRQLSEIGSDKKPFFSVIYTLSTHAPFDMPMKHRKFVDDNYQNLYLNSALYTDSVIGDFIRKAKTKDWYDNTLFVFIPDHSHDTYKKWAYPSPGYCKTFMLFYGNVIDDKYKGQKVDKLASNVDFPVTLLSQMNLDASGFKWSKNIMNPYTQDFAYNSFEEGIGWIRPWGYFFYDNKYKTYRNIELTDSLKTQTVEEGKSFIQAVFQNYMDL
jgi:phosphoglycerol transferase MdoB-like AlkP superfamily enzyme